MFSKRLAVVGCLVVAMMALTASRPAAARDDASPVTFHKDVLPILQKNCQACHRPGEIGPMSFLTYQDTRPWARAIKTAVASRQMPPWFADPAYGHFANDRTLSDATIKTLTAWVDGGAREGDAKDAPPPVSFVKGWSIKPDMIVEMPQDIPLPATGTINYKSILVKVNFPEDVWVAAADTLTSMGCRSSSASNPYWSSWPRYGD